MNINMPAPTYELKSSHPNLKYYYPDNTTKPFCCPVCLGRGEVEPGFYVLGGSSSTSAAKESCKSCNGTGIVWRNDV